MSKFIVGDLVEFTEACTARRMVGVRAIILGVNVQPNRAACQKPVYSLDAAGELGHACECVLKLVPPDGDPNEGVEWDWRELVKAKETT